MAIYTVLSRKVLTSFVDEYGLGKLIKFTGVPAGSVNTHYSLETSKGKFFLKVDEVKNAQEAQQELDLLLFLRAQGFVCPYPLADRKGRYASDYQGKIVSVYPYLAGKALTEKEYSLLHVERIGQALAALHLLAQSYKKTIENRFRLERITELYQDLKTQLPAHFRHLIHVLDDEFEHQTQYAEERLPKGIIHGDLFADNILFRGGKVTAVLDFEAAGYGKFIFDLATAVNALCYIDGGFLIERFDALLRGYQAVRTLTLGEWDAFPNELRFSALRFTITRLKDFFLRPMDEQTRVNKDFRDFFERLQVLRRERPGGMDRLLLAMATGYDYRQYQKVRTQSKPEHEQSMTRKREGSRPWVSASILTAIGGRLQVAH
ncbi:MAG TPA: homoserine kinase [Methylomirabilota bacterium]|jgi:homoserine kinase type II|nr:homoserine kinase [Methylomirabilota bacterium]